MSQATAPGRREAGKRQRIERILAAAHELLKSDPGRPFTVEQIADRAGVSPATVFNLVGTRENIWNALAKRSMSSIDFDSLPGRDDQERARRIADEVMRLVSSEPELYRTMLREWSESARLLSEEPVTALLKCFAGAAERGTIAPDLDHSRLVGLVTASLLGHLHQWAAEMISTLELRQASQDQVDMAFAAARAASFPDTRAWLRARAIE